MKPGQKYSKIIVFGEYERQIIIFLNPIINCEVMINDYIRSSCEGSWSLTATTESRAATATISAQETTPGHKLSI